MMEIHSLHVYNVALFMRACEEMKTKAFAMDFQGNKYIFGKGGRMADYSIGSRTPHWRITIIVKFGAFPNDTVSRLWVKIMIYSFTDRTLLAHE